MWTKNLGFILKVLMIKNKQQQKNNKQTKKTQNTENKA